MVEFLHTFLSSFSYIDHCSVSATATHINYSCLGIRDCRVCSFIVAISVYLYSSSSDANAQYRWVFLLTTADV